MNARLASAIYLTVGFAAVSYIAVFVEPDMGFTSMGDFLDPTKVAAGFRTGAWRLENLLYLTFPIAFWVLAKQSDDAYLVWSGVATGLFFLLVGAFDRTMMQMPDLLAPSEAAAAVSAILAVRFAVLKSTVAAVGVFAWRCTRTSPREGTYGRAWRGLGWVALAVSVAFVFVFLPAPLMVTIWAAALTAREARAPAAS